MTYFCEQTSVLLPGRKKGTYLVTSDVQKAAAKLLGRVSCGTCHIFCQHTSCSLSLNENADPHAREDLQRVFDQILPEVRYEHHYEGSDDMPSHALAVLCGCDLTVPVSGGKLQLGTWQGVYLNEHRSFGGDRTLLITVQGVEARKE